VTGPSANGNGAFDLGAAAEAAATEAEGRPFAFTYKGASYQVPTATAWPMTALRSLANGDLDTALAALIGAEAFDGMCDAGLTLGELNTLFENIAKDSGLNLPNSPPLRRPVSPRTSKRR
jgi:hypothetical protein